VREKRMELYRECLGFLPARIRMDRLGYEDVFMH
jgi:hypothetical protein